MSINFTEMDTSNPRDFALGVCDSLSQTFGVDVTGILLAQSLTDDQKLHRLAIDLSEAAFLRAHSAGWSDFLDSDIAGYDPSNDSQIFASSIDDTEPNLMLTQSDADFLKGMTGDAVKTYVFNLTKRFENMATAKSAGSLVLEMVSGGIIAVGVPMGVGVVKALVAKEALRQAMLTGIKSIGMKTAIGAVVIILAALLLYLLLENPKKILGMIINDTDDDFIVKNWNNDNNGHLFLEHGHMADFMEDGETLSSPRVQIKKRVAFAGSPDDSVVYAGIYFANRNVGFRGAEGIMVFTGKDTGQLFAHQFAVPYMKDNGTNICLLSTAPSDMSKQYRKMYDARKIRVDIQDGNYVMTSTVNHARGGVVGCIASITQTAAP